MDLSNPLKGLLPDEGRFLYCVPPTHNPGLCLLEFDGYEGLSELYSFHLTFRHSPGCPPVGQLADAWLGRPIAFGLSDVAAAEFHGVVLSVWEDEEGRVRADIGPRLSLLGHSACYRAFTRKTSPQVVEAILVSAGLTDYECRLGQRSYRTREVCLQLGESDAGFANRLLEEEGIFYFFRHSRGGHRLVLADHSPALATAGVLTLPTRGRDPLASPATPALDRWLWRRSFAPGSVLVAGHNPLAPRANLKANVSGRGLTPAEAACRIETGLARCERRTETEELAALRLQAAGADRVQVTAAGTACVRPGQVVARLGDAESYLVRAARHSGVEADGGRPGGYACSFECLPVRTPFRPPLRSHRPQREGHHTAVVVGRDGRPDDAGAIFLDEFGRVRVRFRWEQREGPEQAVPARLAPHWPGSFGPPRIGQEVAVSFDECLDYPIVVGLLPSSAASLPHDTTAHPAVYTVRLPATPQAGRDADTVLQVETASGSARTSVQLPGHFFQRVAGEARVWVAKLLSLEAIGSFLQKIGGSLHVQASKEVIVQAGEKVTIKVGGSVIVIAADGITINGQMLYLNSPGGPSPGTAEEPKSPEKPI